MTGMVTNKPRLQSRSLVSMRKVGRDARTGQFIPIEDAKRRKATAVVETIVSTKTKRKKR